ncbi:MAG: HDOD domain-containing protein [Sulfuricurvum sp.]|nr:HDOD domain-containing protein [Sulfuricurvum sp.]MDP3022022.1 HDOD domain-containing protein [Sulfuricurvum sp.]
MDFHFIGRQPIIDHDGDIFAYDLYFSICGDKTVSLRASVSTLISSLLNTYGVKNILGERPGFIQIDHTVLLSDMVESIPKEHFILSILDSTVLDKRVYHKIIQLYNEGYQLALYDITLNSIPKLKKLKYLFPYITYLKINMKDFSQQYLSKLKKAIEPYPIHVIGTHINNYNLYGTTLGLNFRYVQGNYFSEPESFKHETQDANTFTIIQLYNMLMSDVEIQELVRMFEIHSDLTLQLLRYINSQHFNLQNHVSSIQQVLTLLGRKALSSWLMLLIYGKSVNNSKYQSPLQLMVQNRAMVMGKLYRLIYPNANKEEEGKVFFVAIMSLSSAVMSLPLSLILKEMKLSSELIEALLQREGLLGELLSLAENIERFEVETIQEFIEKHHLNPQSVFSLLRESITSVNKFESSIA